VDARLTAFLSRARAAHHRADVLQSQGDVTGAIAALRELTDGPLPTGDAPEVREVLADALGRQAELLGQTGALAEATSAVERGLSKAPPASYYEGYLYEVQGGLLEKQAAALEKTSSAEAQAMRQRALAAFERAMANQAAVIRELSSPDAGAPAAP